jgi:hypothetical protein
MPAEKSLVLLAIGLTLLAAVILILGNADDSVDALAGDDIIALDMNPAGNTSTSLGTIDQCAAIAIGSTVTIDVVVERIPNFDPETPEGGISGMVMNILYPPALLRVTSKASPLEPQDGKSILTNNADSEVVSFTDPLPDTDGNFKIVEADTGPTYESGAGRLYSMTFTAVGAGTAHVFFADIPGGDGDGVPDIYSALTAPYPIGSITHGKVIIGAGSCPSPTATPIPTPTASASPIPLPSCAPTPTPPSASLTPTPPSTGPTPQPTAPCTWTTPVPTASPVVSAFLSQSVDSPGPINVGYFVTYTMNATISGATNGPAVMRVNLGSGLRASSVMCSSSGGGTHWVGAGAGSNNLTCTSSGGLASAANAFMAVTAQVVGPSTVNEPTVANVTYENRPPANALRDSNVGPLDVNPPVVVENATNPAGVPHAFVFALTPGITCEGDMIENADVDCSTSDVEMAGNIACTADEPSVNSQALSDDSFVVTVITPVAAVPGQCSVRLAIKHVGLEYYQDSYFDVPDVIAVKVYTASPSTPTPVATPTSGTTPTPNASATGTNTPTVTPTHTVAPTGVATVTVSPTPVTGPTPGPEALGNADCTDGIDVKDAIAVVRQLGGLGDPICAENGDANCSGEADTGDVLAILLYIAGLPSPPVDTDCSAVGS